MASSRFRFSTANPAILAVCCLSCSNPDRPELGEKFVVLSESIQALPISNMERTSDSVQIEILDERTRFGMPPRSEYEYFGGWLDGALTPDGAIVLSDRTQDRLLYSDHSGGLRSLASFGSGPGEFRHVTGLMESFRGGVGVLDTRLQRLSVYSVTKDTVILAESSPAFGMPTEVCALDADYVGLDYDPEGGTLFTVYRTDGSESRFGRPLVEGSALLNRQLARGSVLCSSEEQVIIAAPETGELLAFGIDGSFRWRKAVPDFEPGLVKEVGGGVMVGLFAENAERSRPVVGLTLLEGGIGVVQLMEFVRDVNDSTTRGEVSDVLTKFFHVGTGQLLGEQRGVPRIMSARNGHLLLAEGYEEPWVRLVGYRLKNLPVQ